MDTPRDIQVYGLIAKFKCLSTSQIYRLVYKDVSEKVCRERLALLAKRKQLKRIRYHIDQEYIYYMGTMPKQVQHNLKIVDFCIALNEFEAVEVQKKFGSVIPDAYIETVRNKPHSFLVEVHRFNGFDFEKYTQFYSTKEYLKYFNKLPLIVIITDIKLKNIPQIPKFIIVNNDMSNIKEVFA